MTREGDKGAAPPPGFNRTKRHWARGFLWLTSGLLVLDRPLLSLLSSSAAVYSMHGGTWLSHKNMKWMGASVISFLVSLYALALRTESNFIDEDRAYDLKATLNIKHRAAEIIWGGILLLVLGLTMKERIDAAVGTLVNETNGDKDDIDKINIEVTAKEVGVSQRHSRETFLKSDLKSESQLKVD